MMQIVKVKPLNKRQLAISLNHIRPLQRLQSHFMPSMAAQQGYTNILNIPNNNEGPRTDGQTCVKNNHSRMFCWQIAASSYSWGNGEESVVFCCTVGPTSSLKAIPHQSNAICATVESFLAVLVNPVFLFGRSRRLRRFTRGKEQGSNSLSIEANNPYTGRH
jgi:hypothetical protein